MSLYEFEQIRQLKEDLSPRINELRVNCADTLSNPADFLKNPLNDLHEKRLRYFDIGIGSGWFIHHGDTDDVNVGVDQESKFGMELLLDFPGDGSETPQLLSYCGFDIQKNHSGFSTVITQLQANFDPDKVELRRKLTTRGNESYATLDIVNWRGLFAHYIQQFSLYLKTKHITITDVINDPYLLERKRPKSKHLNFEEIVEMNPYQYDKETGLFVLPIENIVVDERTQRGFKELFAESSSS